MPHLLATRTYLVLAVACLLGFGGGLVLAVVDSPGLLFYVLGVLLVGLYATQALKPGVGIRPFRRRGTERLNPHAHGSPSDETQGQPSTTASEPAKAAEPSELSAAAQPGKRTANFGLAGGRLDAMTRVAEARKTVVADDCTMNYGLAGGYLDATKQLQRARRKTVAVSLPRRGLTVGVAREMAGGGR